MADAQPTTDPNAVVETIATSGGRMAKIRVVLFIVGVIALEIALAYMYFGSAEGGNSVAAEEVVSEEEELEAQAAARENAMEASLGEFNLTTFQPPNTSVRLSFQLYGIILTEDEPAFTAAFEEHQQRFRGQILEILRSSELTDFQDPVLGLIKRKILEKTNRLFGKPLVQDVIFSDFNYFEQ
jgi:flagellar basal body-associated protein FliL